MSAMTSEMESLKSRLKSTWTAGDFGQIAKSYELGAADFISHLKLKSGTRVLDVACGTGNLAIPAARTGAIVAGVDIAINSLEQGQSRAETEGLAIQFDEGDAEDLPYEDSSFDTVVSMFGVIFAPQPEKAAAELIRVCSHGGVIALANWPPNSFIAQMFKAVSAYVPPPPIMPSPLLWGDDDTVRERLGDGVSDLRLNRQLIGMKFSLSVPKVIGFFREYYGPIQRAFDALNSSPDKQDALRQDLEQLWSDHNCETGDTTYVESEYLEVIATRS